jgi:hypothetical protein
MVDEKYNISVGTNEGKIPLERSRWEDNIKMDLRETGCEADD